MFNKQPDKTKQGGKHTSLIKNPINCHVLLDPRKKAVKWVPSQDNSLNTIKFDVLNKSYSSLAEEIDILPDTP